MLKWMLVTALVGVLLIYAMTGSALSVQDLITAGSVCGLFGVVLWLAEQGERHSVRRWSALVSEWKDSLELCVEGEEPDPVTITIRAGRVLRVDHDYVGFERHGIRFMLPTDSIVKMLSVEVPFEDKPNVVVQVNREYWNKFDHGLHVGELKDLIRER